MPEVNINLAAALSYAAEGTPVIPLNPERRPLFPTGDDHHRASTDEATIRGWWARWPNAKVGLLCHQFNVLDIDSWRNLRALRQRLGDDQVRALLNSDVVRTQHGLHVYTLPVPGLRRMPNLFDSANLELRGIGHYVCAPPSIWQKGGTIGRQYHRVSHGARLSAPETIVAWRPDEDVLDGTAPPPRDKRYGVTYDEAELLAHRSGGWARSTPEGFLAHCPCSAHARGDRSPSLSVTRRLDDPRLAQFKCFVRPDDPAVYEKIAKAWGFWQDEDAAASSHDRSAAGDLRIVQLSDVIERPFEWAWKDWFALAVFEIIDGDPGIGKSTVVIDLLARITRAAAWPDGQLATLPPSNVLFMGSEDALETTIKPRFMAAGGDPERFFALEGRVDDNGIALPLQFPADALRLEEAIRTTNAVAVFIDIIGQYTGKAGNDPNQQRQALAPLNEVARRTNTCILTTRHFRKSEAPDIMHKGAGPISIIGLARIGLAMGFDPNDDNDDEGDRRRVFVAQKSNISKKAPSLAYCLVDDEKRHVARVEWLGTSSVTADRLFPADDEQRDELTERDQWLRDLLAGGPQPAVTIFKAAKTQDWSPKQCRTTCKRIGAHKYKDGMDGGWMWSLQAPKVTSDPEGDPPPPDPEGWSPSVSSGHLRSNCSGCGKPMTVGVGGSSTCTECFRPRSVG